MSDTLVRLLNEHKAQLADALLATPAGKLAHGRSDDERRATLLASLDGLIGLLRQSQPVAEQTLAEMAQSQLRDGIERDDVLALLDAQRDAIYEMIEQTDLPGPEAVAAVKALERLAHQGARITMNTYSDQTIEQLQEASATQAQLREAIQELSTPIIPVYNGVLVLPLVGRIDNARAQNITEGLLEAIAREQAELVLLDITGVAVVDTGVANHLMQTARAASLLGSEVVLVGISAEVAQTLVQLGLDLGRLTTLSNLQSGIEYALAHQGLAITPKV
jgi:rsbT co-antagonist protein RsbR